MYRKEAGALSLDAPAIGDFPGGNRAALASRVPATSKAHLWVPFGGDGAQRLARIGIVAKL